jgi:hypothetical protein
VRRRVRPIRAPSPFVRFLWPLVVAHRRAVGRPLPSFAGERGARRGDPRGRGVAWMRRVDPTGRCFSTTNRTRRPTTCRPGVTVLSLLAIRVRRRRRRSAHGRAAPTSRIDREAPAAKVSAHRVWDASQSGLGQSHGTTEAGARGARMGWRNIARSRSLSCSSLLARSSSGWRKRPTARGCSRMASAPRTARPTRNRCMDSARSRPADNH